MNVPANPRSNHPTARAVRKRRGGTLSYKADSGNCLVLGWRSDLNGPLLQPLGPLEPLLQAFLLGLGPLDALGVLLGDPMNTRMYLVVGHVGGEAQHRRLAVQQPSLPSPPPRPQPSTPAHLLSRLWSKLPPQRRQEVLLLLSQLIAKSLPPATRKEARHEHP